MPHTNSLVDVELMWAQDELSWGLSINSLDISYMKKLAHDKIIFHIIVLEEQ